MGTNTLRSDTMKLTFVLLLAATACVSNGLTLKNEVQNVGDACSMCMEVIGKIKEVVTDPTFETEVVALWDGLCTSLPFFVEECEEIGNEYIPQILAILKEQLDPATVCSALGLCSSRTYYFS